MNDTPQPPQCTEPKSKHDRGVKLAFGLIVLVASAVIYFSMQRKQAQLPGWTSDLPAALSQAQAENKKVLVVFTHDPMNYWDTRLVKENLTQARTTAAVLKYLDYPRVHLRSNKQRELAQKYGVGETPHLLLLSPQGDVLAEHQGFLTDLDLCNNILETSASKARAGQSSAAGSTTKGD